MNPQVLLVINASFEECGSILRGISRYQSDHGAWEVFIDEESRAETDENWLTQQKWDGVISRTTTKELVDRCAARGIPLIDLHDGPQFPGVLKIRPDNVAIGHMAAEDLFERGYRNLYFCGYQNQKWSEERRNGFFEALRLLGCGANEFLTPHQRENSPELNAETIDHISSWLRTLPLPAGVMAANDYLGRQILIAAQRLSSRVPEELAVIGVNDDQVRCELARPPLSSVATDTIRAGYLAAEGLDRRMNGEIGIVPEVLVEPLKIVTRRSTDSLAIEDRAISMAVALIREKACQGITVAELTRGAGISRGRLERGFRHFLGRSPQEEIRRVQLAKIKQLLTETDLPLKEIALMTGFEYVEYLGVSFKREVGESPGRFRRKVRQTTISGTKNIAVESSGPATAA